MLFGSKKTQWEKLEEIKNKKLKAKDDLTNELASINEDIRKAVLEEKETAALLKAKQNTEERVRNIEQEIKILEEELSKVELEHLQSKFNEFADKSAKVNRDLEPHRAAYEKAKENFKKDEEEWFAAQAKAKAEFDEITREQNKIRPRLDELTDLHNANIKGV